MAQKLDLSAGFVEKSAPNIGDKDSKSGRTHLQPTHSPEQNQKLATEGQAEVLPHIKAAVAETPGASLHSVRETKTAGRTKEKIEEGKPASTVPDYSAMRISVDSPEAHKGVVEGIKKRLPVVREKDEFDKGSPSNKFNAHMLQVQGSNQASHEVQVLPKETAGIAESYHPLYKKSRAGDKDAQTELQQKNTEAMDKFKARNGANPKQKEEGEPEPSKAVDKPAAPGQSKFEKGQHVMLPDGRSASVEFHDHRITGNARVKADDGERIQSIAGKKLTAVTSSKAKENSPHILVDFDGTLAKQPKLPLPGVLGQPVPKMVERVKEALAKGEDIRIFTARVSKDPTGKVTRQIEAWCQKYLGQALPITDVKDAHTTEIWDDKAREVTPNTGDFVNSKTHILVKEHLRTRPAK